MVDDRLARQIIACLILCLSDLGEDILARPGAAFGHHRGKIIDQELAARNAAPHRGEGQRHADHADRRLHHVDERLVYPFRLRAPGDTEEARSEEHTSELQSLMSSSYADFCLIKQKTIHSTSTYLST